MSKSLENLILLADDNEDDITLFKRACAAANIANPIRTVRDGEEAIKYLRGEGEFSNRSRYPLPHTLIIDLKMPRKGGFEVLQWVRKESDLKDLRVVVMTNSGDLRDLKKAYELGANTFLVKAVAPDEFIGELKQLKAHWL